MKRYMRPEMEIDLFEENSGLIMAASEASSCVGTYSAPCLEDGCVTDEEACWADGCGTHCNPDYGCVGVD